MNLSILHPSLPMWEESPGQYHRPGESNENLTFSILSEHTISVWLNDILSFRLVCTPEKLADMILGRLFTEGMIQSADDIDRMVITETGEEAKIYLHSYHPSENTSAHHADPIETIPTSHAGSRTLDNSLARVSPPEPVDPIAWKPEWVYTLAKAMKRNLPLYDATHSAHCAMLMKDGIILTQAEDLGRHNALDKVIGWALRTETDLRQCVLFTSGRVPLDMISKILHARIPVLVSKATPTIQSVELARRYRITLICSAFPDGYKIFHDASENAR